MTSSQPDTAPAGVPAAAAAPGDDVARIAAELAARGRVDFDAFFRPGPVGPPREIVIGVPKW